MADKQLIVVVEGTATMAPFWHTILYDYLYKIIRSFWGNELTAQKQSAPNVELSLVIFNAHESYTAFLVQRSGWIRDIDIFFQRLSGIPFACGGFNNAATAEGLAEALMMFSPLYGSQAQQNGQRHCILVAASNPYTRVNQSQLQKLEQSENIWTQTESRLPDAEAVAKSFAQCSVSLSVICTKQLPRLEAIYNAGKRNPGAADPPIDNVRNPYFVVLISENFKEACAALSQQGMTSSASNNSPVKMEEMFSSDENVQDLKPAVSGMKQSVHPLGPGTQSLGVNSNKAVKMPSQQTSSEHESAKSKYEKVWEGSLYGLRRGQPSFITRIEAYRNKLDSETLAANWPPTLQIARLISIDHMKDRKCGTKADFLVFRAWNQHGFLGSIREKKLCAVIELPSQTLLLSVSDKTYRLIGMLLPGGNLQILRDRYPNSRNNKSRICKWLKKAI